MASQALGFCGEYKDLFCYQYYSHPVPDFLIPLFPWQVMDVFMSPNIRNSLKDAPQPGYACFVTRDHCSYCTLFVCPLNPLAT